MSTQVAKRQLVTQMLTKAKPWVSPVQRTHGIRYYQWRARREARASRVTHYQPELLALQTQLTDARLLDALSLTLAGITLAGVLAILYWGGF